MSSTCIEGDARDDVFVLLPNNDRTWMLGLLETLEGIQYEHEAHEKLVGEVYLGPVKACLFVLRLNACSFQQTHSDSLSKYSDMVETILDLAPLDTHTYTIKPDYDEGLRRLAVKLMEVGSVLRSNLLVGWLDLAKHSPGKGRTGRRALCCRQESRTRS